MAMSALLGLAGVALAYCALLLNVMRAQRQSRAVQIGLMVMALFFALFPILDEPLVIYFRGVFGDLSVATLLLSGAAVASVFQRQDLLVAQDKRLFYLVIAMMSLLLYPFALGWGQADTYRLGYHFGLFEWLIFSIGLFALALRAFFVTAWIALSLISYELNLYESRNLWDYLIDPVVSIIALSAVISSYVGSVVRGVRHRALKSKKAPVTDA